MIAQVIVISICVYYEKAGELTLNTLKREERFANVAMSDLKKCQNRT
jgi:hypothetical protein